MDGLDAAHGRGGAWGRNVTTIDTATPVVIFRGNDYRALGVVRSLGRLGVRVVVVEHEPRSLAVHSRFCAQHESWDFESSRAEKSIDFLMDLARRMRCKPVLIPGNDQWSLFVDRFRDRLSGSYLIPQPRAGSIARLYSKQGLAELCAEAGVPTPRTEFPSCLEQAQALASTMRFPLVLKAIDPNRLQRHAWVRMLIVRTPGDLAVAYQRLDEPGIPNLVLQEFIPTDELGSGVMSAYFDARGQCRFAMTGRKLRQLPIDGGVTSQAICAQCDEMIASACCIAEAAGYCGAMDADFCLDTRDGRWKLLDVNPRMGANFRAMVDRNGLDVARALYLDLTGKVVPAVEPDWGRRWLVEGQEFDAVRTQMIEGSLAPVEWLRSIRPVSEFGYWSAGDLRPSLRYARSFLGDRLRGVAGRLKRWQGSRRRIR